MFLYDVVDDSERRRGRQKHLLTLLNFNILFGCSLEWKSTDIDTSDFTLAGESSGMLHKRTNIKRVERVFAWKNNYFKIVGRFPLGKSA
jgi:hypothetical protein